MIEIKHRTTGEVLQRIDAGTLRGADLSKRAFKGADLRGADLRDAVLSGASFDDADLRGAWLDRAHCPNGSLIGTDLRGASLQRAMLSAATLAGADLRAADLQAAVLTSADLTAADLRQANLQDAEIDEARFDASKFEGANFRGVTFYHVYFSDLKAFWLAHELGAQFGVADLEEQIYRDGYRWVSREMAMTEDYLARLRASAQPAAPSEADGDWTKTTVIRGSRHEVLWAAPGLLQIGSLTLPIGEWLERYEEIALAHGYSPRELREYKHYLEFMALQMAREIWPDAR